MDSRNFNIYAQKLPNWTFLVGNQESKYGSFYSDSYSSSSNKTSQDLVLVVENRATLNSATITVERNAYTPTNPIPGPTPQPNQTQPNPTPQPTPPPSPYPPGTQYTVIVKNFTFEVFTFPTGFSSVNFTVTKKTNSGFVLSFLCNIDNYISFLEKKPWNYLKGIRESTQSTSYKDGYVDPSRNKVSGDWYLVVVNEDTQNNATVTVDLDASNPLITSDGHSYRNLEFVLMLTLLINYFC